MRLPYPARIKDVLYTDFEIDAPTVDTIAKTRNLTEQGKFFPAMRPFVEGSVTEFRTSTGEIINDPISMKGIVPKIPYKSIEFISLQAMLAHFGDDDGVEGIYPCPRCGKEVLAEYSESDGMIVDTRDKLSDLTVNYYEDENSIIHLQLTTPVEIMDKKEKEIIMTVKDMDFEFPTLEHCINAEAKVGMKDAIRLQIAMYVECMVKVNGEDVDHKFKNQFGSHILGNIRS